MFEVVEIKTGIRYTIYWIHRDKVNGLAKGLVFRDGKWEFATMDEFIPVELAEEVERDLERHPRILGGNVLSRRFDEDDNSEDMDDYWE